MERHLLITVGDDLSSLHGVRFVGSFFENKKAIKLTLVYVAFFPESAPRKVQSQRRPEDTGGHSVGEKGRQAMEESRKLLLLKGFRDEFIDVKLISKRFGTAKDIVKEAKRGLFDAAILGRRGFAVFEKALSTSVSREILEQRIDFPIWICKRPEEGRRNVLLCVDDTEPSLRIADHVGFMVHDEDHCITIFHADEGEGKNSESIVNQARQALLTNGIAEERIRSKIVRTSRVAGAIAEEAEGNDYAAVAVGRGGGQPKGMLRKWLVGGSVSMKLLDTLEEASLWVSK
jgi:nucleotide-binding universal stress UspA family protein